VRPRPSRPRRSSPKARPIWSRWTPCSIPTGVGVLRMCSAPRLLAPSSRCKQDHAFRPERSAAKRSRCATLWTGEGWIEGRNVQIDTRRTAGDPERIRRYPHVRIRRQNATAITRNTTSTTSCTPHSAILRELALSADLCSAAIPLLGTPGWRFPWMVRAPAQESHRSAVASRMSLG
jgi:hypothetical protein